MKDELASLRQYLPARDERFSDSQPISMEANKADTPILLTVDAFIASGQDCDNTLHKAHWMQHHLGRTPLRPRSTETSNGVLL